MPAITDFRQLDVWKAARELVREVYPISRSLPKEELYSLSDQMRRAAISIPSNIAEGWGRSGTSDYPHFLSIALGSVYELQTQLILCVDLGSIAQAEADPSLILCERIAKMLNRLIAVLGK